MAAIAPSKVVYPESDGKPVGETDTHLTEIFNLLAMLRLYFAEVPDVYVACDLFVYYEEGNPEAGVAPDLMVVRGTHKQKRRNYLLWEEKVAPCCVIEVTSKGSRLEDLGEKRVKYALIGVPKYFLFDPQREYLDPPLICFRLGPNGDYRREDGLTFDSTELGLRLSVEEDGLRLYDLATGRKLLTPEESEHARLAAEAEVRRLRAEIERLRRQG